MELPGTDSLHHTLIQHQRGDIGVRNDRALLAGQPTCFAEAEEALDLFIDPAHRLNFTKLVDGAGNREALLEWRA